MPDKKKDTKKPTKRDPKATAGKDAHYEALTLKYRPGKWLFAGQKTNQHISEAGARAAFYHAKKKPVLRKVAAFMHCAIPLPPMPSIREWIYTP